MEKSGIFLVFGLVLSIGARPDGFDDEGEISVPRSPKIQGPSTAFINYTEGQDKENLQCRIEGSPTPTVIWLRNGQELQANKDPYNTTYDVAGGLAELNFLKAAYNNESTYIEGNFTCIAANFLGRTQKNFVISKGNDSIETGTKTSTTNLPHSTVKSTVQLSKESESSSLSSNTVIARTTATAMTARDSTLNTVDVTDTYLGLERKPTSSNSSNLSRENASVGYANEQRANSTITGVSSNNTINNLTMFGDSINTRVN